MAVSVLQESGSRVIDWQNLPGTVGLGFGEIPDERANYGFAAVRRATEVADNWFVYGAPYPGTEIWGPPNPNLPPDGTVSSDRLLDFWDGTVGHVNDATAAHMRSVVREVMRLARSAGEEGRIRLFEADMYDWHNDKTHLPVVTEAFRGLFDAREPLRDDTQDTSDPLREFGTKIQLAFSGNVPFLLVERAELVRDKAGREKIIRLMEIVKTSDPRTLSATVHQFSYPEARRVLELMVRWQATPAHRQRVFERANRSIGKQGRPPTDKDIRRLMEQADDEPLPETFWRLAWRAGGAALGMAVDPRLLRWLESKVPGRGGKHRARHEHS